MADNNGGSNSRSGGAQTSAAATAIGFAEARFQQPERRRRWGGCWGGFSFFGSHNKGSKRIVPSRIPEGNIPANRANGPQPDGVTNPTTTFVPSLLAPPSSPASFTNSALPSTVQSPNCFLSLSSNSLGDPSSTMFTIGPYAHETQLVSPPVPSTFTTEPSTAPLTPPPESAHLTTPSSPDVPFARFLSSYPGSPTSSLISPKSRTSGDGLGSSFPKREFPAQWDTSISSPRKGSSHVFGHDTATSKNFILSQDSSFFYPATSAQFYLDQAQQPFSSYSHSAGRLSFSREADGYSSNGNGYQNWHGRNCKADVEEIEAYRASFGFSADEIITTPQYVEISDVQDESFTMKPFASNYLYMEETMVPELPIKEEKEGIKQTIFLSNGRDCGDLDSCDDCKDCKSQKPSGYLSDPNKLDNNHILRDEDDVFSRIGDSKANKRYRLCSSISDAEIDYRRSRSLREGK